MLVILEGLSVPLQLSYKSPPSYLSLKSDVLKSLQIDLGGFSVSLSGRLLLSDDILIQPDTESDTITVLQVQIKVLGGKGGFGSQLKAIGAQIQKTTSRDACRDLSGRRVRDVNGEKAFNELAREQKRRVEERRQQKIRRREKRWAQRTVPPRLADPTYYQSLEDNAEGVTAAFKHAHSMNGKRPCEAELPGVKRPVFCGMDEDLSASESEGEEKTRTTTSDSIPPILSVEQILHTPILPDVPEEALCNQTDTVVEAETDNTQTQILEKSPNSKPNTDTVDSTNIDEQLNDDVITVQTTAIATETELIDLGSISTREDLEKFGLESLKQTLIGLGLKCGGTLQERVGRLYTYKITPKDQLPTFLFAGKGRTQAKKSDKGKTA